MTHANGKVLYPRLLRRVRAFLIDSVLFIVVIYTWMLSLPVFGEWHFLLKIAALIVPLMIIEPGLVAFTGGTLGHHIMGLRIRDASRDQNIGILRATARAIIRTLLGWLSFVFVLVTRRHQALHDYLTSTVVVLRRPEILPAHEKFPTRTESRSQYVYPSKVRRVAVIFLYMLLGLGAILVLSVAFVSEECLIYNRCSFAENVASHTLSILWLLSLGATIVLGWRGLLYGCRRTRFLRDFTTDS